MSMLFTLLIYNYRNSITSLLNFINILNIGNELYSVLSRPCRQSYLMLTELPEMISVFNTNYQFQYSSSYAGSIRGACALPDFNYSMALTNAMQTLLEENNSFLLKVKSNIIGMYYTPEGRFKLFDSNAGDLFGMPHPQGTCGTGDIRTSQLFSSLLYNFKCLI